MIAALLLTLPASAAITGLERVATGLSSPMYVSHAPGDFTRLFICQKGGVIRILNLATGLINPVPFLTISDTDAGGDGGLQSMAFHPDYATNGLFYVHVTVDNGGVMIDGVTSPFSSHIREYAVSAAPDVANPAATEILSWVQPRSNHNGGWIGFSPGDVGSYLYIMSGDGGKQNDPDDNAQTLVGEPLGKVLRVDVDGDDFPGDPDRNYAVPPSNPFVSLAGDDEIWAYGLRNPWRASFDLETADLWIGDVGQSAREEIDFQASTSSGGENYAWNRREGLIAHQGGALLPGDVEPVYDYAHGPGDFTGNSVVGGYVYRGADVDLQGLYFFADTVFGNVWTFDPSDPVNTVVRINDQLVPDLGALDVPVSFGEDAASNLYIVDFLGDVFRISADTPPMPVPTLSVWGTLALAFLLISAALPLRSRASPSPNMPGMPNTGIAGGPTSVAR